MMLTRAGVDYIGVTFSSSFDEHRLVPWVGDWKPAGRGNHGYEKRQISEYGADIVSEAEDRLGKHFRIPGAAWQAMRDSDMAVEFLPQYLLQIGGKPTRIDLALDMHESETSVDLLHTLTDLGQIRTRARMGKRITSTREDGFYVGSRGSDKFCRVYDKRLEQDTPTAPRWVRVELQMRKRYASLITVGYCEAPNKRNFINRAIADYVDWPTNSDYQEAIRSQDGDLPLLHHKPPKIIRWLAAQVIPALLNYQDQNPDVDVMRLVGLMYHEAHTARKGE
jgi:hypothetical protein